MPSAIEIFKLLPKTNCQDCNQKTCLAYAMGLANGKFSVEDCPHLAPEAKASLATSSEPPVRLVTIGTGKSAVKLGDESVMFRHEKRLENPTAYGLLLSDNDPDLETKLEQAISSRFERVGENIGLNVMALECASGQADTYLQALERVIGNGMAMVLMAPLDVLDAALGICADKRPLIWADDKNDTDLDGLVALALKHDVPAALQCQDDLKGTQGKAAVAGLKDMVLDIGGSSLLDTFATATNARAMAVKRSDRIYGHPLMMVVGPGMGVDENQENNEIDDVNDGQLMMGALGTLKYSSLLLFRSIPPELMYTLYVLRQNVYTDPQVPIQVEPGIYELNNPTPDSPVVLTVNFSLTYFSVHGDLEKSKIPVHLFIVDTEGMSVLTAFSAGKLTPQIIEAAVEEFNVRKRITHNQLIIRGLVGRMADKLGERLGMEILVGPKESNGLAKYLRRLQE